MHWESWQQTQPLLRKCKAQLEEAGAWGREGRVGDGWLAATGSGKKLLSGLWEHQKLVCVCVWRGGSYMCVCEREGGANLGFHSLGAIHLVF